MAANLCPVAMAPDTREILEVRRAVLGAILVVPECYGHTGKRSSANQFARNESHRSSSIVENVYRHSESGRLNLSLIDRQNRIAQHEAGDDVTAAADAGEVHVRLDFLVDVIKAVVRQRTSRRKNRFQCRQIMSPAWLRSALLQQRQIFCAGAEDCNAFLLRHLPQNIRIRGQWRTVVKHDLYSDGERAEKPVPHHPAACRVVKDTVFALEVGVEDQLFQVLEQRATGAVHHALGQSRRARRVHDVQGVIELKSLEAHCFGIERFRRMRRRRHRHSSTNRRFQNVACDAAQTAGRRSTVSLHWGRSVALRRRALTANQSPLRSDEPGPQYSLSNPVEIRHLSPEGRYDDVLECRYAESDLPETRQQIDLFAVV